MKPKIFISSTIYDFKDLRSALKFWIDEMGYEAVLSEFNDFNVLPNKSSYDNCIKEIENCDFFILLIGGRAGGLHDKDGKVTITMQEYRKAYELSLEGRIKIIPFVRQSVWDVREDRNALSKIIQKEKLINNKVDMNKIVYHNSSILSDAEIIINFIKEVSKTSKMNASA